MVTFSLFSADRFPLLNKVILHSRITWSVRLRWAAIFSFALASIFARDYLNLPVKLDSILSVLGFLAALNLIYFLYGRFWKEQTFDHEFLFLSIHIVVDLVALTMLLHYSGGVENPVYIFYIFHVVISSIIFPGIIPWLMATFVVLLFLILVVSEYFLWIPHTCIFHSNMHNQPVFIVLSVFTFTVTTYVTTYICKTFMTFFREIKSRVDEQNRKLEQLSREKMQFFRFTSHELKTPLIAVKSAIDSFANVQRGKIPDKDLHILERASSRAGQMLEIITELLELTRTQLPENNGKAQETDLRGLVGRLVDISSPSSEAKKIELNIYIEGDHFTVFCVEKELEKILLNLLSNAINYTPPGGKIEVRLEELPGKFRITVKDTGIGIPEEDLPNIFSEFFRSKNAREMVNFGTGLGLSLVKNIADKNCWNLEVKSLVGKGTEFILTIPAKN
jgi:signal transduction histidine kinase